LLPANSLLVFNETKVIPARLLFRKTTGAPVELFCLAPLSPAGYEVCFAAASSCEWRCIAGNSKRWKSGKLYHPSGRHGLSAEFMEKQGDSVRVRFAWDGGASFAQILEQCGVTPLPPYLKRDAVPEDALRYQTIYARYNGSVAAPTAGLHFTQAVLDDLAQRGIASETLTLHVGAGTFRPVKTETIAAHVMHREPFTVSRRTLQNILKYTGNIIAVGTTSTRTLESLYFLGQQCLLSQPPQTVTQWEACDAPCKATPQEALQALLQYMEKNKLEDLHASTQLLIAPPYRFRIVRGMVTNFHQPQSTLLLLVSAFIGDDWRKVYRYALQNGFRFLSYGDSSLLQIEN
jgi:S-adenosylmethionine:tRNA ribosyltransferase-isomerase